MVEVPRETILSIDDKGREVIVAGLSPVNGMMTHSTVSIVEG